jgi:hypothetical protein
MYRDIPSRNTCFAARFFDIIGKCEGYPNTTLTVHLGLTEKSQLSIRLRQRLLGSAVTQRF